MNTKEYIVNYEINNEIFSYLVSAKDTKDAIRQIREHWQPIDSNGKCTARSVGSLHNEYGKTKLIGVVL